MRRQATELFDSLGALRDCHVLMEWVEKLGPADDSITRNLWAHLRHQEAGLKEEARLTIEHFDRKQWDVWNRSLPLRTARLPLDSAVFNALPLEKLTTARRLQRLALKTNKDASLHRLRIALKKFRYLVENFLPRLHEGWKDALKRAQDLLGEIHDLDVLREAVNQVCLALPYASREVWDQIIANARNVRIERYREIMSGEKSLWSLWRSELPRGEAVRHASLSRLQAWSAFLDSDLRHSRRVARFAVQLYDDLVRLGVVRDSQRTDRDLLRAAATVHEVGRAAGDRNHHKKTAKMLCELRHLAGWRERDVSAMAQVARYHRGTLPGGTKLQDIPSSRRNTIKLLAGVLRLANGLDANHDGSIRRFTVTKSDGFVTLRAQGLDANSSLAETIAKARHLLEISCNLPVLVQPMPKRRSRRQKLT